MVEIFVDAATKGNPGPSGGGIFIKGDGDVKEYSLALGSMSNHEAEFYIFLKALEICQEKNYKTIWLKTDSKIVYESVEKQFVKNPIYKPYLEKALLIINRFDLFFIKWISDKENKADRLARAALQNH